MLLELHPAAWGEQAVGKADGTAQERGMVLLRSLIAGYTSELLFAEGDHPECAYRGASPWSQLEECMWKAGHDGRRLVVRLRPGQGTRGPV